MEYARLTGRVLGSRRGDHWVRPENVISCVQTVTLADRGVGVASGVITGFDRRHALFVKTVGPRRSGSGACCRLVRCRAVSATQRDPGAQACYQRRRDAGDGHEAALRRLAGKLIGQLHYCLVHRCHYDPSHAWSLSGGDNEQTEAA